MKDGPIVKRNAVLCSTANRIVPVVRTRREADEVLDADRSLVGEQCAAHLARGGLDDRGWLTGRCMVYRSLGRWRSLVGRLRPNRKPRHRKQNGNQKNIKHECSLLMAQMCPAIYSQRCIVRQRWHQWDCD